MKAEYDIVDSRFLDLILHNVQLMQLSSGHMWTEGPVWVPAHQCLYFSDIPNQRIHRWTPDGQITVFRENSGFANGNTLDAEGRLITCQHGTRSVTRTNHDGSIETLADKYGEKPLNSPNDVVVKADDTIWFTDPTYGIMGNYEGKRAVPEQAARSVFCFDQTTGSTKAVIDSFAQPNGLAFSPDETRLYIADSGASHDRSVPSTVYVCDVTADNTLSERAVFAEIKPGIPDGLRVDCHGNVWISSADSVQCFDQDGKLLGRIFVPEVVSNLEFGGPRNTHLFITATTSLYAIHVNTQRS
ncbi:MULTISPECIES: SMP-30/gluconolactonase/LRE family protein [unclassified Ruegeria]|uniref:SMP-30/gluconolactonase/LRE family protein n=1 Tax=unclassified Ruegeria TaxID=2625375 RepID=UPI0014884F6D|nr:MULTISPECIES: SMP-30/gluconolactonase/LRE family protein [unclassified Ruegeria]